MTEEERKAEQPQPQPQPAPAAAEAASQQNGGPEKGAPVAAGTNLETLPRHANQTVMLPPRPGSMRPRRARSRASPPARRGVSLHRRHPHAGRLRRGPAPGRRGVDPRGARAFGYSQERPLHFALHPASSPTDPLDFRCTVPPRYGSVATSPLMG